jgi:2'-5' RNA ligase
MPASNFFFLLVSLPQKVNDDVSSFKKLVFEILGHSYRSFHSTAHLTLRQYYDFHNESELYTYSESIEQVKPFGVHIDGFGKFERNGTIYLKVTNSPNLSELARKISGRAITPHVTIARGLSPKDFAIVWPHFEKLSYNYHFTCECVTVLKRIDNRWRPHMELPFSRAASQGID